MADTAMGLDYSLSGDTLNRVKNAGKLEYQTRG